MSATVTGYAQFVFFQFAIKGDSSFVSYTSVAVLLLLVCLLSGYISSTRSLSRILFACVTDKEIKEMLVAVSKVSKRIVFALQDQVCKFILIVYVCIGWH